MSRGWLFAVGLTLFSAPGLAADFSYGLDVNGECKKSINCFDRKSADNAKLLDDIRIAITAAKYKCTDTIPAASISSSHKGMVYVVQCGSSGLRYRIEIYDDRKTYTVRPTQADRAIDVLLN